MDGEGSDQSQSLTAHRSELKKRGFAEVEETSDSSQKRMKMRDLESVFQFEGGEIKTPHPDMCSDSRELDLNINVSSANRTTTGDNPYGETKENHPKARPFSLDLNTEDVSSSANDPFFSYKSCENSKQMDDLECGSSVGPPDERDSMRVWKGLKQNNYMSPFDSTLPASIPKPRGKKKVNNDLMKKKIEQAKKEQVDRFARVAAPSGLLNGLNPGIINHVRNSKQVHSIIEALVKSEKRGNRHIGSKKFIQGANSSGVDTLEFSRAEDGLMGRRQISDYGLFSKTGFQNAEVLGRDGDSEAGTFMTSQTADDKLALKLSSSVAVASENNSCLSNDESANLGSVNSLSFKAANVASQWLELLNQDIKGRLTALRRSKRRVRAVITTELPLLLSREFPPNVGHFDQANVDAHSFRWRSIFERMETTLSEEEGQLESWLNQVKEMQLHCEKGLYKNTLYPMGNESSSEGVDKLEKDLAVKAAAASIYSTCNFLLGMEKC
ncbi:Uncharacterised conserved protein (UCP030365 [Striga hermonthica]|uniref:Uncharacterized conserved protein (UCP030365) n=1 Tax=Striga hermonthica TaxID=68872 RepID=A0A9N7NV06_STRHE|nr:Uncharacterised conserved protein (UCP030365 [Striga hermonthica]